MHETGASLASFSLPKMCLNDAFNVGTVRVVLPSPPNGASVLAFAFKRAGKSRKI